MNSERVSLSRWAFFLFCFPFTLNSVKYPNDMHSFLGYYNQNAPNIVHNLVPFKNVMYVLLFQDWAIHESFSQTVCVMCIENL